MVSASLKRNFINVWGTKFLFDYMKSVGVVFNKNIIFGKPLFQSYNHKSKSRLGIFMKRKIKLNTL